MTEQSTISILVLDDDHFMLEILVHVLAELGYTRVTTCDSGRIALNSSIGLEDQPNLILLDLKMPEMDGIEFVRKLVDCHYAGGLILMSDEVERVLQAVERLAQAHRITVLGHLNKPFKPERLAQLIEKWTPLSTNQPLATRKTYDVDEVRVAIANNELINYYQPQVAVATGQVVGVEALVRWNHPEDGLVFPDQFIGVSEIHGLIDDLTRVVFVTALDQLQEWYKSGLALRMAVNVSMDNLTSLDFADFVIEKTAEMTNITPRNIVLEVTESRLMEDLCVPLEILTRLCINHFRLSIDDFGTGHSSLSQLQNIPFTELKIDRRFVHNAKFDKTARAIYKASLDLAKKIGIESMAEGVEDQNDWDFLRQTKCDFAQGYFIAKPMPAESLIGWMQSWESRRTNLLGC